MLRQKCKRVQVQGLKDSRITIRGDKDQGLASSEYVSHHIDPSPSYSVCTMYEGSVKGCRRAKHKTYGPLDDDWVIFFDVECFKLFLIPTR